MSGESQERDDAQLAFRAVFLAGVFLAGDFFAAAFLAGAFFAGLAGFWSSAAAAVSSLDSPRAVLAASTLRCRAASRSTTSPPDLRSFGAALTSPPSILAFTRASTASR